MKEVDFIKYVFEIAFGDNAYLKEYTYSEVVEKLKEFSDKALDSEKE